MAAGVQAFGRLDVVVNNAGYANLASVEDITLGDFREQVDANLLGVVNSTDGPPALGDPAKVAQVVLAVADMDDPPLRLILGSEAYAYATAASQARAEADAKWHDLSVCTDRDDATAADRDPLGTRAG